MHQGSTVSSDQLLQLARQAVRQGDQQTAHQLCVQLTRADPTNEPAWLWRASTSESVDETIAALSAVVAQDPSNVVARRMLQHLMGLRLQRDAFVGYVAESDQSYRIYLPPELTIEHPKDRIPAEPFPPARSALTASTLRWLGWSIIGLIPSGLGTLICAPMAVATALKLLRSRPGSADRQRALIVLALAIGLWFIALTFALIFLLHLS